MCGIAGWFTPKPAPEAPQALHLALRALSLRGPDHQATHHTPAAHLGHARLSILDTSAAAHQPMLDPAGRYAIVFNGEIFNFHELAQRVRQAGVELRTTSDTEVLLHLLILHGAECLNWLNGFFAFAFLDMHTNEMLLARDRLGIKPLVYFTDETGTRFASELKALLAMGIPKRLNPTALQAYLTLNYVPPNLCMLQGVHKLPPGHCLQLRGAEAEIKQWWRIPRPELGAYAATAADYEAKQKELIALLDAAVRRRLVADVPLGVFLSGGIDSSTIAALAARHKPDLKTFSLGFHNPLYDETRYAEAVARKIGSAHTVFRISEDDLYAHLHDVLDYLDEPFADASALNFFILSKFTRQHVTVALSGDGADELFGGYSKHLGEFNARRNSLLNLGLRLAGPIVMALPGNRNSRLKRRLWQLQKYTRGLRMDKRLRYLQWASVLGPPAVAKLLQHPQNLNPLQAAPWAEYLDIIGPGGDFNDVLHADMRLVLPGDMLVKADMMSMANSLEVRVPFLDYTVVEFAFGLPSAYKIGPSQRKRILQDAARHLLPPELYNRPKQGFEVPLADWFRGSLRAYLEREVLDPDFLHQQGLFNPAAVNDLWQAVLRGGNGKEDWTIWALVVFQHCWRKYGFEA